MAHLAAVSARAGWTTHRARRPGGVAIARVRGVPAPASRRTARQIPPRARGGRDERGARVRPRARATSRVSSSRDVCGDAEDVVAKTKTKTIAAEDARRKVRHASTVTGAYIAAVGACLLVAPVRSFSVLFDASSIATHWIRVFGVLCVTFGVYYLDTARGDGGGGGGGGGGGAAMSFYRATVRGRAFVALALASIAMTTPSARVGLSLLAFVNAVSAGVMQRALRVADAAAAAAGEGNGETRAVSY